MGVNSWVPSLIDSTQETELLHWIERPGEMAGVLAGENQRVGPPTERTRRRAIGNSPRRGVPLLYALAMASSRRCTPGALRTTASLSIRWASLRDRGLHQEVPPSLLLHSRALVAVGQPCEGKQQQAGLQREVSALPWIGRQVPDVH